MHTNKADKVYWWSIQHSSFILMFALLCQELPPIKICFNSKEIAEVRIMFTVRHKTSENQNLIIQYFVLKFVKIFFNLPTFYHLSFQNFPREQRFPKEREKKNMISSISLIILFFVCILHESYTYRYACNSPFFQNYPF